jgi:hypothetical protein
MIAVKPSTKKYLTWIAIALVLFYVLKDPHQAAQTVQNGLGQLQALADAVISFLTALVS